MATNKDSFDIIVIGGGASGMMAAGRAAECGARVILLEKKNRLGLKLLISGKGRCNLTNIGDLDKFLHHFGKTRDFLHNVFHRFFNQELIEFFQKRGLYLKIERGGRVFPASNSAFVVVKILTDYLIENKVKIIFNSVVKEILIKNRFIDGVKLASGEILRTKKVILTTGGKSYPRTGSTGNGYKMASKLGHTIIKPRPALVPLETREDFVRGLQGLSLDNVQVKIVKDNKAIVSEFGDMLFTHFGISGPIILSISGDIALLLETEKEIILSLDLKPALEKEKLMRRIIRDAKIYGSRNFKNYLKGLLPHKMIMVFISLLGISPEKKLCQLTKEERNKIVSLLKDFPLTVTKTRPIEEAIITQGGVSVGEINPRTMESRLIRGLYFCGEIIDVDARTGGYNLQAAFSTGYIAGESAAKAIDRVASRE